MEHIAFTGPIRVGKSTLCEALQERHNYWWINFTDHLKELAIAALQPHKVVTLTEMRVQKELYRPFLQAFGSLIGFDSTPLYVNEALYSWNEACRPPATFDNVRSDTQAQAVRLMGFRIIRLELTFDRDGGLVRPDAKTHPIESGISNRYVDGVIDANQPLDVLVDLLRGW